MRSSMEKINIAASAQRLDVDNRISLRYYHRIADNILKQVFLLIKFIFFPVKIIYAFIKYIFCTVFIPRYGIFI